MLGRSKLDVVYTCTCKHDLCLVVATYQNSLAQKHVICHDMVGEESILTKLVKQPRLRQLPPIP